MKIMYVITGMGLGGAEVSTVNLANKMAENGYEIFILYLSGKNAHLRTIAPGIRIAGLQMQKTMLGLIRALRKARQLIREYKPDVVHGQMFHANLFIRLLRIVCPIPLLISTEHSQNIESKVRMLGYRLSDFLSDVNTNVSEEATQYFIREHAFSRKKSLTVFNGIDLSVFCTSSSQEQAQHIRKLYGINESSFVFLHVGRFHPAKDHQNLLTAFARVVEHTENTKLILVGDGELREKIEMTIREYGLQERVILAGAQRNVADYYHAADCFVMSSAWEGMPLVLLEAAACGKPAIATAVSGSNDILPERYIVPTQNPQALSDTMLDIYSLSDQERENIGKQNRNRVLRFDSCTICRQWQTIYDQSKKYH